MAGVLWAHGFGCICVWLCPCRLVLSRIMWLYFDLIAHLCHLYLIAQATNGLVSVSLLMNSSKHNLRTPPPRRKLQVKSSRCWLFSFFFFFHMIRFWASILVTRLLFWCSAESRFYCDLLILDACSFNNQMMNQALTVQSVILLMEIIWNSATHEWWSTLMWSFLKALNNEWHLRAVENKITAKTTMFFFFYLFLRRYFELRRADVLAMQSDMTVPAFINECWASPRFNGYQPVMRCRSHIYLGLQLLCKHYTASTVLPLCRITLYLPAPKRRGKKIYFSGRNSPVSAHTVID